MKPTEFVKVNGQFWGEHLKGVGEHLAGSHRNELPGPLLFPRMMVLTETPDWNILELVGVSREYRSLEVRRRKAASVEEYFGLGDGAAVVSLPGENLFKDATVATEVGRRELVDRFPGADKMIGNEFVGPGEQLLQFAPGNYSLFDRVLLVHTVGASIRVHWTFFALTIHRSEPADKYLAFLRNYAQAADHLDPIGTLSVPVGDLDLKGSPFASTYLGHGLPDSTVEQFLEDNESILLSAFDATRLIRRPFLERQEDGDALQPDFILETADGNHIVGDLGLPLLEGKKHHRSTSVPDSAAALARYADYFTSAEHRDFAQTKYGVEVSDPRKVLVIGSHDTVNPADVTDAAIEIVDYDSLLRLHLAANS